MIDVCVIGVWPLNSVLVGVISHIGLHSTFYRHNLTPTIIMDSMTWNKH